MLPGEEWGNYKLKAGVTGTCKCYKGRSGEVTSIKAGVTGKCYKGRSGGAMSIKLVLLVNVTREGVGKL